MSFYRPPARVIRTQILLLRWLGYVEAAHALGAGAAPVILRHVTLECCHYP